MNSMNKILTIFLKKKIGGAHKIFEFHNKFICKFLSDMPGLSGVHEKFLHIYWFWKHYKFCDTVLSNFEKIC